MMKSFEPARGVRNAKCFWSSSQADEQQMDIRTIRVLRCTQTNSTPTHQAVAVKECCCNHTIRLERFEIISKDRRRCDLFSVAEAAHAMITVRLLDSTGYIPVHACVRLNA